MSYLAQSRLTEDKILAQRLSACAAACGVANPEGFVSERMWKFSARDGWPAAYARATVNPAGADEAAITDTMIEEAVHSVLAEATEAATRLEAAAREIAEAVVTDGAVPPVISRDILGP